MIVAVKRRSLRPVPAWHAGFLAMAPTIINYARNAFGQANPEAREDLIEEVVANALVAYVRLFQQGRIALAYPTVLARYGVAQVRDGRRVGAKMNITDPLSAYCQRRRAVVVGSLDRFDAEDNQWVEAVVEDHHTPVFDQVQFRCDFPAWLDSLTQRNRRVATALSLGHSTGHVAERFKLSEGRISQLRHEFQESWRTFVGELNDAETTAV